MVATYTPRGVRFFRSLHIFVEGNDFFGMPPEVVVTVLKRLETSRGVLDPEQFFFLARKQVEGLLRASGFRVQESFRT